MNRLHRAVACASFTCISLLLASCMEELEHIDRVGKTTFQPEIGFPLIQSTFTMEEFLTEGGSKAAISEESGVMVLTYVDSVFTTTAENIFTIPDQQSPVIAITGDEITFPSPGGSVTLSKELTFAFDPTPGDNLDSILLKAGHMAFTVASSLPANVDLLIEIPSLKQQGSPFGQRLSFAGPGTASPSVDLQDATLDLTDGGTTTNTVTFAITATITDTGQPINSADGIECSFDMTALGFRGLFGNVATRAYALSTGMIDVDIFGNGSAGNIAFLSPEVRLSVANSFGVPVGFDIQKLAVIEPDDVTTQLTGPAVSAPANPYLLDAPSYAEAGQSTTTGIDIHAGNSNLDALFSSLPHFFEYQLGAVLDPLGNTQNFVLDDSRLAIGVHLELPFHGKISALTLLKEYEFDGLGIDDIHEGTVKVKTVNEIPLDAAVQVYFVDASGTVLDSLFTNPSIIEGAQVDADGFSQNEAPVITEVPVTEEKLDRVNQAEYLLVRAEMHTTNQGTAPVKFSAADKLQISIGLQAKVEYTLQ